MKMDTEKSYVCDMCKEKKKFAVALLYPEGEMIMCMKCLMYLVEPFLVLNSNLNKDEEM